MLGSHVASGEGFVAPSEKLYVWMLGQGNSLLEDIGVAIILLVSRCENIYASVTTERDRYTLGTSSAAEDGTSSSLIQSRPHQ